MEGQISRAVGGKSLLPGRNRSVRSLDLKNRRNAEDKTSGKQVNERALAHTQSPEGLKIGLRANASQSVPLHQEIEMKKNAAEHKRRQSPCIMRKYKTKRKALNWLRKQQRKRKETIV
ncbi:hypothetical protein NDU88_005284 [Pleurodeles waltl]|uniref:Uncharacterized protein n=1 Tax=Pleurodeles waltl TaxID=8319 RepID=A0AAV7M9I3_PLEWA|nr:hypothetical protein NDU88_005284 [Pleurodeles waltl]